jgi:exodeoxyribonuclease-1
MIITDIKLNLSGNMNPTSYFFYDLETSGLDPKKHRIMQFAGIRTNLNLEPIDEPINFMSKLSPEVIPSFGAIKTTGITPQMTLVDGIAEREAIAKIMNEAFTPDTIIVGFNNISFDDEFIRYTSYRNFWDPYEWAYADGRSRWDILDVTRLTRALRPDGIIWPTDNEGNPVNTLEKLASANKVEHLKAHDALSDVEATIAVARLIKNNQPRLFEYLLNNRSKEDLAKLINPQRPAMFVYCSGILGKENSFIGVFIPIGYGENNKILSYNLSIDPEPYINLGFEELKAIKDSQYDKQKPKDQLAMPALQIALNKCPVVAPITTIREDDAKRLGLNLQKIKDNLELLNTSGLGDKITQLYGQKVEFNKTEDPDAALYDGFIGQDDKMSMINVRRSNLNELSDISPTFKDERLNKLWLRYKARNLPESLDNDELKTWSEYVKTRKTNDKAEYDLEIAKLTDEDRARYKQILSALNEWSVKVI